MTVLLKISSQKSGWPDFGGKSDHVWRSSQKRKSVYCEEPICWMKQITQRDSGCRMAYLTATPIKCGFFLPAIIAANTRALRVLRRFARLFPKEFCQKSGWKNPHALLQILFLTSQKPTKLLFWFRKYYFPRENASQPLPNPAGLGGVWDFGRFYPWALPPGWASYIPLTLI